MPRRRFRNKYIWPEKAPPTDDLVEHAEFTREVVSRVNLIMPSLSHGQQVVITRVLEGKNLGNVAREYQSEKAGEDDLSRVDSVYQDAINTIRKQLTPFAYANDIRIPEGF